MWNWYQWTSEAEFVAWHDSIKAQLGLPKMSKDELGNDVEPVIDSYTAAVQVDDKWIARVEDAYASNLIATEVRPLKPEIG